ncbi:MAG: VOC family protein [Candidatus Kariarchaeaceae archaeon]
MAHFEIPVDDLVRAKQFYNTVFGWTSNDMPEHNYTFVNTTETDEKGYPLKPGAINGGFEKRSEHMKHPILTITVQNIDKSLEAVAKEGGEVIVGTNQMGDVGIAAYIKDSEGNVMGLWQSLAQPAD